MGAARAGGPIAAAARHGSGRARWHDDGVPSLSDLASRQTMLTAGDVEWLHALVSDWQLIADLSFADLTLWAPVRDGRGWLAMAQMRPDHRADGGV